MHTVTISLPLLKSLLTLASVIEARDACTGGHIWRVSRYADLLAQRAGLDAGESFSAYLGGLVSRPKGSAVPESAG